MTFTVLSAPAGFPDSFLTERELLDLESRVCSYGDTVHYAEKPKIFERCEGSYLYDLHGTRYLDLQMWYSAVNLGYANPRISAALLPPTIFRLLVVMLLRKLIQLPQLMQLLLNSL